ncbi:penicillin-binding protein 2 [Halorhodospira halophila]|uniref:penicillin-binding protein 2 n=1 Tax=Halorhodospira halophila TaxID=1053 RepID=UPI0019146509|nr:penicillin-binding protein 2 [Halorhodospira halophila]
MSLSIRDQQQDAHRIRRRIIAAGVLCILVVTGLMTQMVRLQVVDHHHYATLSQENRIKVNPIPPSRGQILDRNGTVLAENRPSYQLVATPERVPDIDTMLDEVGEIIEITEAQRERFLNRLNNSRHFEAIPLRTRLDEEEVAKLAVHRHRLPGLEVDARLVRHYPKGYTGSHAVGYVGRITAQDLRHIDRPAYRGTNHIGKSGVEHAFEQVLHGEVGVERVETNAAGRVLRTLDRRPPRSGEDLILTLDIDLQEVAERALGEQRGAVVAMDPNTGELLAMASRPHYDPNMFVRGMSGEHFQELEDTGWQPLINRPIRGLYPPASTIKPFVGLAALEHDVIRPDTEIHCDGAYHVEGRDEPFRCWRDWGHGETDYIKAIAESCNVFFYDTAFRLGIDRMSEFLEPFGFGSPTRVDTSGERSGILPNRDWKRRALGGGWYHGETVITGIGLGYFSTTPMQLARATAILANQGRIVEPRLVQTIRDGEAGHESRTAASTPQERIELNDPEHWELTTEAMRAAVEHPRGTARLIGDDLDYSLAGKTGTAQVTESREDDDEEEIPEHLRSHALFIGFAPAEDPEIAVVVVVENAEGGGGAAAAPVARAVTDAWLVDDHTFLEDLETGRIDESEVEDEEEAPMELMP